jgi:hypothetical protein
VIVGRHCKHSAIAVALAGAERTRPASRSAARTATASGITARSAFAMKNWPSLPRPRETFAAHPSDAAMVGSRSDGIVRSLVADATLRHVERCFDCRVGAGRCGPHRNIS